MKLVPIGSFLLMLWSCIPHIIMAQPLVLEIHDCNSITVRLGQENSSFTKSFSLEKMIATHVWSQEEKAVTKNDVFSFTDLDNGTYRIRVVETISFAGNKKSAMRSTADQHVQETLSNTFVINNCKHIINKSGATNPLSDVVQIYPNPAQEHFSVHIFNAAEIGWMVWLYDLLGQKMLEQNISSSISVIDVSHLPKGIYLISLMNNEGQLMRNEKLIISEHNPNN